VAILYFWFTNKHTNFTQDHEKKHSNHVHFHHTCGFWEYFWKTIIDTCWHVKKNPNRTKIIQNVEEHPMPFLTNLVQWFVRKIEMWKVYWKQTMTDAMIVMRKLHMVLLSRWAKNISLKINNGVQHHWSINDINNK